MPVTPFVYYILLIVWVAHNVVYPEREYYDVCERQANFTILSTTGRSQSPDMGNMEGVHAQYCDHTPSDYSAFHSFVC